MTSLIKYYQPKPADNYQSYILFFDKKNVIKQADKSFLKVHINTIDAHTKIAINNNDEISEFYISAKIKIILCLVEPKKEDIFNEKKGGRLFDYLNKKTNNDYYLLDQNLKSLIDFDNFFLINLLHGLNLKSIKLIKKKKLLQLMYHLILNRNLRVKT